MKDITITFTVKEGATAKEVDNFLKRCAITFKMKVVAYDVQGKTGYVVMREE